MAQIEIDTDLLMDIRTSLSTIEGRFTEGGTEQAEGHAEGLGPDRLVSKAIAFIDDSKAGYDRMAKNISDLKESIDPIIESFQEVDDGLAANLEGDQGSGGNPSAPGGYQAV